MVQLYCVFVLLFIVVACTYLCTFIHTAEQAYHQRSLPKEKHNFSLEVVLLLAVLTNAFASEPTWSVHGSESSCVGGDDS